MKTRIAGLLAIAVLVSLIGVSLAAYQKKFISTATIYVTANRSGLLLDQGADVKVFGLAVGDVRKVEVVGPTTVRITLAIDTSKISQIPANAQADISGTTVFGPKFVSLMFAAGSSTSSVLRAGQTVPVVDVGTEINDVFKNIVRVVDAIDPVRLNETLTAVASALKGRGAVLGDLLVNSDQYVRALNGESANIQRDIRLASGVFDLYADTAPQLLSIAGDGATTSRTLSEQRAELQAALVSLLAASKSGTDLLATSRGPLRDLLENLAPVLQLTDEFAPVLTCTIKGMAIHSTIIARALGLGQYPGVTGVATIIPGQTGYTSPKNLPKFVRTNAPTCYGLPVGDPKPPHYMFDDGTKDVFTQGGGVTVKDPVQLYLGLVKDFFGEAGVDQLLKPEPTTPREAGR